MGSASFLSWGNTPWGALVLMGGGAGGGQEKIVG